MDLRVCHRIDLVVFGDCQARASARTREMGAAEAAPIPLFMLSDKD